MVIEKVASVIDFLFKKDKMGDADLYDQMVKESNKLVRNPLKVMAYIATIFGVLVLMFEIRNFDQSSFEIYIIRVSASIISLFVLIMVISNIAVKHLIALVHVLLLTIIISSALMIFVFPKNLLVNSQIVGLIIFTSALFLGWDIKNQIMVAIYYTVVFTTAILLNDKAVNFLPNVTESVIIVTFLSIVSIVASAYNFKLRSILAKKKESEIIANEAVQFTSNKSKFLATMSHEIRTPMNGILGFLTLIESGAYRDEKELNQFASNARQSTESLIEIINSILDLSKIESGKMKLEESDFVLNKIIDHVLSVLSTRINEKEITIVKEIPDETFHQLYGDSTKLRQIFLNLLGNAVKFTSQGEIKINLKTVKIDEENINLYATVTDSGIGIPADKIKALFKPFSQIKSAETSRMGGTGLGLVICKEFVNQMGGKISVSSEVGIGSTFTFSVKLKASKNSEQTNEELTLQTETVENEQTTILSEDLLKKVRTQFHILLAEDNLINQKVSLRILQASGFKASAVNDGAEAIKAVKEGDYDLVLMDIQMPQVDGFAATEQIRNFEDDKRDIPIIALTAHAMMGYREKCLKAGFNEYLSKPIATKDMFTMIDELLDIKNAPVPEEPTIQQTDNSLFDFERLKKVSADDFDFEKDLLSSYVEDVEKKCIQLEDFLAAKDLEGIIHLTHTIKGSSYSVGAQKVGDEAFGIEISAKSGDLLSVEERLLHLKHALEETKEVLITFLVA
jgi:signal transduction histidine kinase/FixJ family two-component response regulator